MSKKVKKFFVSYQHEKGFGRGEITSNGHLSDLDDIREIERQLGRLHNVTAVLVTNIIPFPIKAKFVKDTTIKVQDYSNDYPDEETRI